MPLKFGRYKVKMQESILLFRLWNYYLSNKIVFASARDTEV
jgi:hypothetical protein